MRTKQFDVLVVGDLFVDIVMSGFAAWPKAGEETFAHEMVREAGGGAAITASGLARLRTRTGVVGVVDGSGSDGGWLTNRLRSLGVNTSTLEKDQSEPTGLTVAITRGLDRTFFTYSGANKALPDFLAKNDVQRQLQQAQHVHFACCLDPRLLIELTAILRRVETRVTVDVGWHPDWLSSAGSIDALGHVDLFMPNEAEAQAVTGEKTTAEILNAFERIGVRRVALKMAERGAALTIDGRKLFCDPVQVVSVDTTGAGDSFDAGFIYGTLRDEPPERCLQIANICGALSTRALGGITAFPSRAEIEELM